MKVRWPETALAATEALFTFIHERNRSAAASVIRRIEELVTLLGEFPLAGHLTDETDVRTISVVRYPFLVFYTITTVPQRWSSCM